MRTFTIAVVLLAALSANVCLADDTPTKFEQGNALLAKGQFKAAAAAYASAAREDPENEEAKTQALLLQRVVSLRKYVAGNEPSAKWEKMVASLHGWYLRNDLVAIAAEEDRKAYEKSPTAVITTILAESLVEKGDNAAVMTLLAEVPEDRRHVAQPLFLAIANARVGLLNEATRIAGETVLAEDASTGLLFSRARLEALLGNSDEAIKCLKLCLERTPARGIEEARKGIRGCADFGKLDRDAVAEVMKTESKVDESGCSGGSGCGSCPSRAGCGK